jgi:hypothetical protein
LSTKEKGVKTIDFIWMDVQGAEKDIIQCGENALTKTFYIYRIQQNGTIRGPGYA